MFKHYLKISFRNLWKYKSQTLISVIGLAVGFACFAIATLWIRYEMTFDSFHKNSDRLYRVNVISGDIFEDNNIKNALTLVRSPVHSYMKRTFPEVNDATKIGHWKAMIEIDEIQSEVNIIYTDSSFLRIFDIRILEGNADFLIPESKKIAVTHEKALQLFGNENPLGKIVKYGKNEYTIGAVTTGYSKHSNYPFDFLTSYDPYITWGEIIIVELMSGINVKSFRKKLHETEMVIEYKQKVINWKGEIEYINDIARVKNADIQSITSIHYTDPKKHRNIKFQHIVIFAVAGSLLILCTLLNYLMLFVSRFRIRQRELALRIVCGASNRSLFTLLSIEFLMSLAISLLFGVLLIRAFIPYFKALPFVEIEVSSIYIESLIYIMSIILIALLVFLLVLAIFRRRALNVAIRSSNKKMFRKASIIVQLIISINFAFCTVIILKQMYFLHNTDLGFDLKYVGRVSSWRHDMDAVSLENKLKQIPEITATVKGYSLSHYWGEGIKSGSLDGRTGDKKNVEIQIVYTSPEIVNFYKFRLVSGEMLTESDSREYVLINESAAQALGLHEQELAGKVLLFGGDKHYIIKGVIKNIYDSPTDPVKPSMYKCENRGGSNFVTFKYKAGTWKTCKNKIAQLISKEKDPESNIVLDNILVNEEDLFDKRYLQSENTLLQILTLVSLVCVIVCVFGFVSMVALTCEERRKEIAIRKINGATVKDILDIFFKEHLTLLGIGALIAFPVGYLIMQRWLESYVLQTEMSAWVYLAILLALMIVIVLCVGGKVYKTSRENPVDAIKS